MQKRSIALTAIASLLIASTPALALPNTLQSSNSFSVQADTAQRINGTVTTVSGNSITVKDSKGKVWTLDVGTAKLTRDRGEALKTEEIKVKDKLEIRGTTSGTTITPQSVKNKTLRTHTYNYTGMVQSVNGTTITTKGKTLGVKKVLTDGATKFVKGKATIALGDITVGSKIKISGTWDRTNKTITAKKVQLLTAGPKKK